MQITWMPVNSSNVAAHAWHAGLLLVQFKGNQQPYVYICDAAEYLRLCEADSVGQHISQHFVAQPGRLVRFSETARSVVVGGVSAREPLDLFEEDPCCAARISMLIRRGSVTRSTLTVACPKCGHYWDATLLEGGARYWKPRADVVGIRPLRECV